MSEFINGKPPDRSPRNKTEVATIVILGVFFTGLMLAALLKDFSVFKLSIPFFMISWILLLVIHEFGHALMARALGWKVSRVSIGTGKVIAKRKIRGMQTEIRAIPLSGYAQPRPADLIHPQMKNFLIYAAGPGIELFIVGLFWFFLGNETLLSREPFIWLIGIQSFSVAAIFGAIINLIPLAHDSELGKTPSDGLGMILAWKIPDEEYAKWMESPRD